MRFLYSLCTLAVFGLSTLAGAAEPSLTLDLWPGKAPGETGSIGDEKINEPKPGGKPAKHITNVTKPTIAVFRPAEGMNTGAAVLVCPGGGYNILAYDHEGEDVAAWLNSIGVTGIVLKYRVPRRPEQPKDKPPVGALQDAQRAMSIVRSKAGEWGIDPKRIGMLGFSAGGHLTAWASTNFDARAYEALDDVDKVSCRPDFAVMIYAGGVVGKDKKDELNPEIKVTAQTPPSFFAHAGNDSVENSITMYLALRKAGVPADLHIYASGGHGFGLRPTGKPCATWPQRCAEWLQDQHVLSTKAAAR